MLCFSNFQKTIIFYHFLTESITHFLTNSHNLYLHCSDTTPTVPSITNVLFERHLVFVYNIYTLLFYPAAHPHNCGFVTETLDRAAGSDKESVNTFVVTGTTVG